MLFSGNQKRFPSKNKYEYPFKECLAQYSGNHQQRREILYSSLFTSIIAINGQKQRDYFP